MNEETSTLAERYTVESWNVTSKEWEFLAVTYDFEKARGMLTSEQHRVFDLVSGRITPYPGQDLLDIEEARCLAVDYASTHNVDENRAKALASKWFEGGEIFGNERKTKELENHLKLQFGLLY